MAEYEACIISLQVALNLKIKDLGIYEPYLIVSQVAGEWAIKSLRTRNIPQMSHAPERPVPKMSHAPERHVSFHFLLTSTKNQ